MRLIWKKWIYTNCEIGSISTTICNYVYCLKLNYLCFVKAIFFPLFFFFTTIHLALTLELHDGIFSLATLLILTSFTGWFLCSILCSCYEILDIFSFNLLLLLKEIFSFLALDLGTSFPSLYIYLYILW